MVCEQFYLSIDRAGKPGKQGKPSLKKCWGFPFARFRGLVFALRKRKWVYFARFQGFYLRALCARSQTKFASIDRTGKPGKQGEPSLKKCWVFFKKDYFARFQGFYLSIDRAGKPGKQGKPSLKKCWVFFSSAFAD